MAKFLTQAEMEARMPGLPRPRATSHTASANPDGAPILNPNHDPRAHSRSQQTGPSMQHAYAYQGHVPQYPYHAAGHYIDPYTPFHESAAALGDRVIPPMPSTEPAAPEAPPVPEEGAIFTMPRGGWRSLPLAPESVLRRQRRRSEQTRRDYYDNEDDDEEMRTRRYLRRAQTERRASLSRARVPMAMTPTTAASSLTNGASGSSLLLQHSTLPLDSIVLICLAGYVALSLRGSDTVREIRPIP